jgi:lysozyme
MVTSDAGIELIKKYEGCRLRAYCCPAGIPTIGYGHTGSVSVGQTITQDEAEKLLRVDLISREKAVERFVDVPLTQGQFDALVSFVYNVGEGAFARSTLLKKLNAGDYAGAALEFRAWTQGGGKVLPGLIARRQAETELFNGRP